MPLLLFHFFAGALAGALFRVQTLLLLALFVLVEVVWLVPAEQALTAVFRGVISEMTLQVGYLAGVLFRAVLARCDLTASGRGAAIGPLGSAGRIGGDQA